MNIGRWNKCDGKLFLQQNMWSHWPNGKKCFPLILNWLLTKNSQSKKQTRLHKHLQMSCKNLKIQLGEVVKDFKLKFLIKKRRFVHKKWKFGIGVSLDFLVSSKLQNCKFLKTCIKMLCSIYHTILVVDKRHAYESFGKRIVQKKSRGKKIIFILVEANTNLG